MGCGRIQCGADPVELCDRMRWDEMQWDRIQWDAVRWDEMR